MDTLLPLESIILCHDISAREVAPPVSRIRLWLGDTHFADCVFSGIFMRFTNHHCLQSHARRMIPHRRQLRRRRASQRETRDSEYIYADADEMHASIITDFFDAAG